MADWREELPEELRAEPMFKDVPDVATLAKVARDLKAYQGRSLALPADDADEAARKEFEARLAEKAPSLAKAVEFEKAETAKQKAAREATEAAAVALKKEWGSDYDDRVKAARAAAVKMGVPESALDSMPPSQVRVWAAAASALTGNAHHVGEQGKGGAPRMTGSEIDIEIAKHRADPEYYGGRRPDLHKRVAELMEMRGG
jgi:hypothetical protein